MPMNKFFAYLSQKHVLIISLIATSIITLITTKIDSTIAGSHGLGAVYLQISFFKINFESIISSWGKSGVELFLKTIWLDFVYPVFYAVLLSSALGFFSIKISQFSKIDIPKIDIHFLTVPFVAAFFDYTENILHIIILSKRLFTDYLILTASIVASIKWMLLMLSASWVMKKYFEFRKIKRAII